MQSRRLTWPNLRNARDLGGLPLPGGGTTRRGVLVRSDSLARLTPVGLDQMIGAGIATVIDLREEWLVGAEPNPVAHDQRVHYHHISLLPASFPLPVLRGGYAEAIDPAQRRVAEVGRAISSGPQARPTSTANTGQAAPASSVRSCSACRASRWMPSDRTTWKASPTSRWAQMSPPGHPPSSITSPDGTAARPSTCSLAACFPRRSSAWRAFCGPAHSGTGEARSIPPENRRREPRVADLT